MEFTTPGSGDASVFRGLREDFEIGLGCVSVVPGLVDEAETIADRVELAVEHLGAGRASGDSQLALPLDCRPATALH